MDFPQINERDLLAATEIELLGEGDLREFMSRGDKLVVIVPSPISVPTSNGTKTIRPYHMTWLLLEGILSVNRDTAYVKSLYHANEGAIHDERVPAITRRRGTVRLQGDSLLGTSYSGEEASRMLIDRYKNQFSSPK